MDSIQAVFSVVDVPLIVGIVVVIQAAKKVIKLPGKLWSPIMIVFGFLAAFLKINDPFVLKLFLVQGFIYAAASEFVYQSYRTLIDSIKRKK